MLRVLRLAINEIGKRHINAGEAEELDTLAGAVHAIGGVHAFHRFFSVRFQVRHFTHPLARALDPVTHERCVVFQTWRQEQRASLALRPYAFVTWRPLLVHNAVARSAPTARAMRV